MKKLFLCFLVSFCLLSCECDADIASWCSPGDGPFCEGTGTLGYDDPLGSPLTADGSSVVVKFTAPNDLCVSNGYILTTTAFTSSDHVKIVIYDYVDEAPAGEPGALLGASNEITGDSTANTQSAIFDDAVSLSGGSEYFIGYVSDSDFTYTYTGLGTPINFEDTAYAGYPTPDDPYNVLATAFTRQIIVYATSD